MNLSVSQQSFLGARGFSSGLGSMDTSRNMGLTLGNTGRNLSLSGKANNTTRPPVSIKKTNIPGKISHVVIPPVENVLKEVKVAVLDDEDTTQTLKELLSENQLLIRYKKGDEIVTRMKKVFKGARLQKYVKFRSDKKIKWSPQYFINDDLSTLKGFMGAELLRLNIIAQLQDWEESESDDFDDRSASESEEEENSGGTGIFSDGKDEEVVGGGDEEEVVGEDEEVVGEDEEAVGGGDEEVVDSGNEEEASEVDE